MCIICTMLDKEKIKWQEANKIIYSGEIPLDVNHLQEVLEKITEKKKKDESK
jgi:hypothetical protein